jgi:hypothetical protein
MEWKFIHGVVSVCPNSFVVLAKHLEELLRTSAEDPFED